MSTSRTASILIYVILAVVSSTASASCHIAKEWTVEVTGRSGRDVSVILPAPYCLLLSDVWINGTGSHYALNVLNGSVAWQWPQQSYGDDLQAVQLLPSANPDRVYALVQYERWPQQKNDSICALLAALHSGNGTAIWQHELCFPHVYGVQPSFAVMQPPLSNQTRGERLVLAISTNDQYPVTNDGVAEVVDGNTGRLLTSTNVSDVLSGTLAPVGQGTEGYFTMVSLNDSPTLILLRLMPDNSINQSSSVHSAMLTDAVLRSQPALRYENSTTNKSTVLLVARDVATNERAWSSSDAFLVGRNWGSNGTFAHFSTAYQLVDALPDLFMILNTAYDGEDGSNVTVVAQAGVYQLSTGKEVSRSPLLAFDDLNHAGANPNTWQFDDILLLRADTVWYMLQLPLLRPVGSGHYVAPDAWLHNNNWLVDPDGSYVALVYQSEQVHGYPPQLNDNKVQPDSHSADEQLSAAMQHRHAK